jgi:ATP-dependent exoDNAse (exonuclease V) alpha subunit
MTKLDPGQRAAVEAAVAFVRSGRRGHLWIGGLAGTGKTFVLQELAGIYPDAPLLAPTNRAAHVIGKKLERRAYTIHKAIQLCTGEEFNEKTRRYEPVFEDKPFNARLVLLDECSMVGVKLGTKLQAVCHQIIAFGDPGQLGPVNEDPYFKGEPDVILTTNHRQGKAGDGIIRAALAVREGKQVFTIDSDEFQAVKMPETAEQLHPYFKTADTILCHTNKLRHNLNDCYRAYRGITGGVRAREILIAKRNMLRLDIINSDRFRVLADWTRGTPLVVRSLDNQKVFHFEGAVIDKLDQPDPPNKVPFFAFGYVTTVNMAQGSEWPRVLIFDDYAASDFKRHTYTAITRGAEHVTVLSDRFPITEEFTPL